MLRETAFTGPLSARLAGRRPAHAVLHWLGQAGFVVTTPKYRVVVDPYLSDSLALKYRGTATPHDRMMPAPISPAGLASVDLVLCTHGHTDHMDAETLRPMIAANPQLRLIVPRAERELARARSDATEHRLIGLDAGETVEPLPGLAIRALPAAHETLDRDANGQFRCLGYCIEADGLRIVHSGDTIPFPGQVEEILAIAPHLALLPVNGRSERLRALGIAGNLTIEEAIDLCRAGAIPAMIAHHYGMFAFNTADPDEVDRAAATALLRMVRARMQMEYTLGRE